jgi:hypothetical protein
MLVLVLVAVRMMHVESVRVIVDASDVPMGMTMFSADHHEPDGNRNAPLDRFAKKHMSQRQRKDCFQVGPTP